MTNVMKAGVPLTLKRSELLHCTMCGAMRQIDNLFQRRSDRYGADRENGWQTHIEGAIGEYVAAKHLGLFWEGMSVLGDLTADDVRCHVQVRFGGYPEASLILHPAPGDDPDKIFVLVTGGEGMTFTIRGWLRAKQGQCHEYWRERPHNRSAFFVPQETIEDAATLAAEMF